jgi:hypothetical protein
MILGIEISGTKAFVLQIESNDGKIVTSVGNVKLEIPEKDDSVESIIDFQKNLNMYMQDVKPSLVVLCEGGQDSKKKRVRMELCVLIAASTNGIKYETYPTGSATKYINAGYKKEYGQDFMVFFNTQNLTKGMMKVLASCMRFMPK